MLSPRVDDLQIAGFKKCVDRLISRFEDVFGKVKGKCETFAISGYRRTRSADGSVVMGRGGYFGAVIPINHIDLLKSKSDQPAEGSLPGQVVGLLGLAACALLARRRVGARIVALQRAELLVRHGMQLDGAVAAMRTIKARAAFPAMECDG